MSEAEIEFEWDVFFCHASADKPTVRGIAERLRDRGLRVWFDEDRIVPGDHIYGKIEEGIQKSRVLVFFASEASLKSEWASLERWSASFRDPTNKERRFITIRLDHTPLPDILSGFAYVEWYAEKSSDQAFERLLNACLLIRRVPSGEITYQKVFTPGSPPAIPELLVGRNVLLSHLCDYLRSPGIHPIVVGDRGIGKTSLVRLAIKSMQLPRTSALEINTVESFDECCRHICDDLCLPYEKEIFTPASFLRTLSKSKSLAVVSIDELDDQPKDSPIVRAFAKFAKAASNHAHELEVKFVFSGIGADAHDIFKGHLSSERNLPQIRLKEISSSDLHDFLNRASSLLKIEIPKHIATAIVTEADGYPYYVHQVGFHMFAAFARDEQAEQLNDGHFMEGKKRALDAAFGHYLRRYKFTIYRLTELEKATLQAFLRTERRRLSVAELQETTAVLASTTKDRVLDAMRSLYIKEYLVHRAGDETIALKDALLKPFLSERLGIARAQSTSKRPPKGKGGQMELL